MRVGRRKSTHLKSSKATQGWRKNHTMVGRDHTEVTEKPHRGGEMDSYRGERKKVAKKKL